MKTLIALAEYFFFSNQSVVQKMTGAEDGRGGLRLLNVGELTHPVGQESLGNTFAL